MYRVLVLCALFFLLCDANVLDAANPSSDEPESMRGATLPFKAAGSYEEALQVWKTAEDINGWIAANFSYDMARALQLSETQITSREKVSIYTPSEFFKGKPGVCVDLSHFAVETLRRIDPHSDPKYLMIEFDPRQIEGNILRLHWLVSFKREGKTYFFADSKRPGHIVGPYNDTQAFIDEYGQYSGRKIVAFQELESYQKRQRTQALKRPASKEP
jgi:hypothetical protein